MGEWLVDFSGRTLSPDIWGSGSGDAPHLLSAQSNYGRGEMATKNANQSKVEWIDVQLSDKQKQQMKADMPDNDAVVLGIEALVEKGYSVSVRYDEWNSCVAAYITPSADDAQNKGKILSGRGRSAASALRGAIFRHFTVLKGVWGATAPRPIDED